MIFMSEVMLNVAPPGSSPHAPFWAQEGRRCAGRASPCDHSSNSHNYNNSTSIATISS